VITFINGSYVYGGFSLAVQCRVNAGNLVAVLGPSGAGKSTLLDLIAGFQTLRSGKLELNGVDHTSIAPAQRPVSMVFQDSNCFAHLDAWKNVALGISPSLHLTDGERDRVGDALQRVGLHHLADRMPGDMSGGERQRIALARALVRNRPILLLDEPFAALGPALRGEMLGLVHELHREKKLTTLLVTHNPGDAKRVAEQVIFVDAGRVREPVATADFFQKIDDPAVRDYLG
jgi:thiamine transport system ATP-binding protein